MGTITTLRPSTTSSGVGWTALPSGTLHGVTSDNSDASYAIWGGDGSPLILGTPVDSPPLGERRHQVRLRARGEDGDAWWAVRLSSGALAAGAAAQFISSPTTVTGSWGFGAPADGPTILYTYVTGQGTGVKINELYLDVDSREAPTFTAQVLDGSGSSTVTVTDTSQPIIRANAVDLDNLNARQYRYWVTLNGAIVWDTGIASGTAANRQTSPLDNGAYVAHLQVWSTLGQNTAYPSAEVTLAFTVGVGQVDKPVTPTVDPEDGTPFYRVSACAPYVTNLDGGVGYVEVQRVDCPVGGYLTMAGEVGAYASTPDPGALTDLQVTVVAGRDDGWLPLASDTLAAQYNTTSNQRSWRLNIEAVTGLPFLIWSPTGSSTTIQATATDRPPVDPFGVVRLRVILDVDDGAGGWTVTFQTRETDDDEWTQLGEVQSNAGGGTTALFNSTADMTVGAYLSGSTPLNRWNGRIYSVEVRNGTAGAVLASPDFTGRLAGTTSFDDTQGNTWTIHGAALIYSPTSTTTLTILGPLGTDQCAEWVDYTLPRSGVGLTCDHAPEPCCSYYRARTIGREGGDLRISDWSDLYDIGIPSGVIVMWPSTEASIPTGWDRVSELDGLYPKGVPDAATQPGTNGGAATHTHTIPSHVHSTSHSHTHTGATSAGVGAISSANGAAGTMAIASTHTHTRSVTNTVVSDSAPTTPLVPAVSNDTERLEVIFTRSDGTPLGVPDGALVLAPDISLSGWTDYSDATNRLIKGVIGPTGGAAIGSALDSHVHALGAHTHGAASSHLHSATANTVSSNLTLQSGPNVTLWQASHQHTITTSSNAPQALASTAGGDSGTAPASMLPPYRNMRVKENTSGVPDLPVGLICAWRGSLGSIPDNWRLCDGTGGTPDLLGRYPRGATASIGTTGGSLTAHTHTGGSHGHTTTGHSHTETVGAAGAATSSMSATATVSVSTGSHTHTAGSTDSATPSVTSVSSGTLASTTSEPPHQEVAFIQMVEEPGPPPEPSTFCLDWDDNEHLIRSTGPAGPIWAPVLGKFEWTVTRPFTAATGINGSRFVTSSAPGERNLSMTAAVESEADLAQLRAVLSRPLVLISPSDANEVWAAPVAESVKIIKIGRIRQVQATFIGTGPQPPPQLADVGA